MSALLPTHNISQGYMRNTTDRNISVSKSKSGLAYICILGGHPILKTE